MNKIIEKPHGKSCFSLPKVRTTLGLNVTKEDGGWYILHGQNKIGFVTMQESLKLGDIKSKLKRWDHLLHIQNIN